MPSCNTVVKVHLGHQNIFFSKMLGKNYPVHNFLNSSGNVPIIKGTLNVLNP